MKTRNHIISDMCFSLRHDFGLTKVKSELLSSGMTIDERKALWLQMEQLYDHVVNPIIIELSGKSL